MIISLLLITWRCYYKPRKTSRHAQEKRFKEKTSFNKELNESPKYMGSKIRSSLSFLSSSRASNVIPIAYIPGVTTRQTQYSNRPSMQQQQQQQNNDVLTLDTGPSIRSSIATTNYAGSSAHISSGTMTAVQAKPNLVDLDSGKQNKAELARLHKMPYSQSAHSINIKKGNPVGLQSQYIAEETSPYDEKFAASTPSMTSSKALGAFKETDSLNANRNKAGTFFFFFHLNFSPILTILQDHNYYPKSILETRSSAGSVISFQTALESIGNDQFSHYQSAISVAGPFTGGIEKLPRKSTNTSTVTFAPEPQILNESSSSSDPDVEEPEDSNHYF